MKFHLKVTEDDIKNGIPENATRCPIALALKRELKVDYVEVDGDSPMFILDITEYQIVSEKKLGNFIEAFDNNLVDDITPFEIDLEAFEKELDDDYEY